MTEFRQSHLIAALKNRDVGLLFWGQLLSQIGDQFLFIAALSMVTRLTASSLALGGLALAISVPQLLLGLIGGVYVDRWSRKRVMIVSDLARGLIVLPALWASLRGEVWVLYPVAAGLSIAGVFFYPARNATIPNIVEPHLLLSANVLVQASYILALIFGASAAGLIVGQWGPQAAILFDAITFWASAGCIALMRIPPTAHGQTQASLSAVWRELVEGLRYIVWHALLGRVLVITAVAALGISAITILGIKWLEELFNRGSISLQPETGFGIAVATMGVGVALGGAFVQRLAARLPVNQVVGTCLSLVGVAIIGFALAPGFGLVLPAAAAVGLCTVVARAGLATLIHQIVHDEIRGRVESAVNMIVSSSSAVAQGLSGALAAPALLGVQGVFIGAGSITIIAGLATFYALNDAARAIASRR